MDFVTVKYKKVLVTGAGGFLGRHLIKALYKKGAEVYGIDRITSKHNIGVPCEVIDLNDVELLESRILSLKPDVVYHLAADLNRAREFEITNTLIENNLKSTVNLLNALKLLDYERFIYISTSDVYGGNVPPPFREEDLFVPASPYALSKYCAEMAVKTFSHIYSKSFTILRLFNFYGEGMSDQFFIQQLVTRLKNNENFDMTMGEQKRDFLYVEDVVRALIMALHPVANQELFNVCSGSGMTIRDIALLVKELLNSSSDIHFGAIPYRANEIWEMVGNHSKITKALDWYPQYSFESGLKAYLSTV